VSARDLPTGTVTFLFTDIEGSTRLLGRLGERFNRVIEDHNRLLSERFAAGTIVRTEGDAFFVVFANPAEAVAAAVDAQRTIAGHDWGEGVGVKVRMGLHTGEGTIAGGDYTGLDVYRTARIAAAANGGQVLLSDATRALAHASLGDVTTRDLGEHRLKDLPERERLFQLVIPGLPADFPPPRSLDARPNNLTMRLTPFIGRERELKEIFELCGTQRLVTLTGPGGTGKTRLSIQLAFDSLESFADGAFFVYLAPIREPELVPSTIATAIGLMEEASRPLMETLKAHLADREVLLVLDNFEQIISAAPFVGELLEAAPRLRCVVTSREILHLSGEQEYPVPPMALPDPKHLPDLEALERYESVALFLQRARAVRPDFALTAENAPAVAEICTRLDGLPLAIELAAARVRLLNPQKLLERLEPMLPLLTGGARDLPERQQTLRSTIGWSYDLLDEAERRLFRRMAVFVGGCSFEAADAVVNPGGELGMDTLEGLEGLVDKSLLRRFEEAEEPRLRMLHVIREYALERLEESDEADEMRRRHAGAYLALAEQAAPMLTGADQPMWLDRLESEHDNFRAALDRAAASGDPATALRLGGVLWRFWQMRGHLREAADRLDAVLALPGSEEHPGPRADALEAAGGIAYWSGDAPSAQGHYRASLELRRELADPSATARAAYNLACADLFFVDHGNPEEAVRLLGEAEAFYRGQDDPSGLADVLWAAGGSHFVSASYEQAVAPLEESIELYRKGGNRFGEAWAHHMLGLVKVLMGHLDEARGHLVEATDIFLRGDDRSATPLMLSDFAILETKRGAGQRALRLAGASEAIAAESGVGLTDWAHRSIEGLVDEMWGLLPRPEAERAFEEGKLLSADDAIAYALKEET